MALEPSAGSSLVKMELMLKVLAFMAVSPVMTLIEMMLNRFFFLTLNYNFVYVNVVMFEHVIICVKSL